MDTNCQNCAKEGIVRPGRRIQIWLRARNDTGLYLCDEHWRLEPLLDNAYARWLDENYVGGGEEWKEFLADPYNGMTPR